MSKPEKQLVWHKVLANLDELPEGRVMSVTAGHKGICLTHYEGKFCALDNKCPHQGGPLGEGSIENGLLRCPWHGWDYDPCTGKAPGFDDGVATYPTEKREDGIYVGLEAEPTPPRTVSDVMAETMVAGGITHVFGMVGHSNLGYAQAMRQLEKAGKLTYIGIRHEGAASFAASAYGKLTGRPAACFAIAGPGSTNMFTGMWDAKNDRAPLLVLSGQVATQVVGTGNFQEVDLVAAFESVAQFNHRVLSSSRHAELMVLALKHAIINREVSHLTFPDEVQVQVVPEDKAAKTLDHRIASQKIIPPMAEMDQALAMIKQAKRPIIIMGHGARFHKEKIIQLAERLNAPVMTTFKGKGLISDHHPLGAGVLGRSGTPIASWFMNEADLLCVLGASFSNHTGITPKIPTIQVDYDRMTLAKFHSVDLPLWGEISATIELFLDKLDGESLAAIDQKAEVAKRWALWREEKARRLEDDHGQGLSSISVFDAINQLVDEDAIITVDVGNNAYSLGRYIECKSQEFIMSGYLGSIGFAFPAAMGAWAAVGDTRQVVAVAGDGGFGQYLAELTTSVKYGMNIKLILINNSELGKISKEQRAGEFDVWQTSLHNPNFADFATSCGALGIRVSERSQLLESMKQVLSNPGTAMLEVMGDVALI